MESSGKLSQWLRLSGLQVFVCLVLVLAFGFSSTGVMIPRGLLPPLRTLPPCCTKAKQCEDMMLLPRGAQPSTQHSPGTSYMSEKAPKWFSTPVIGVTLSSGSPPRWGHMHGGTEISHPCCGLSQFLTHRSREPNKNGCPLHFTFGCVCFTTRESIAWLSHDSIWEALRRTPPLCLGFAPLHFVRELLPGFPPFSFLTLLSCLLSLTSPVKPSPRGKSPSPVTTSLVTHQSSLPILGQFHSWKDFPNFPLWPGAVWLMLLQFLCQPHHKTPPTGHVIPPAASQLTDILLSLGFQVARVSPAFSFLTCWSSAVSFSSQTLHYPWMVSFSHRYRDESWIHLSSEGFPAKIQVHNWTCLSNISRHLSMLQTSLSTFCVLFMAVLELSQTSAREIKQILSQITTGHLRDVCHWEDYFTSPSLHFSSVKWG